MDNSLVEPKYEITNVYIEILKELDEKMDMEKRKYNLNSIETILYETIREILKHLAERS